MENYEIADILKQTAKLMELHGENTFKIRSYQNAAFKLDRLQEKLEGKSVLELELVDGIGKSLSIKIFQLLTQGSFPDLEKLLSITPEGVLEMMELKGIGPKKVAILWKELGLESLGELLYACNENRLIELKGFGEKTQDLVKHAVEFKMASSGLFHFATAEQLAKEILHFFATNLPEIKISFTGDLRRKCEIIDTLNFIVSCESIQEQEKITKTFIKCNLINKESLQSTQDNIIVNTSIGLPLSILFSPSNVYAYTLWISTGSEKHIALCLENTNLKTEELSKIISERDLYTKLGLDYIEPELREGLQEVDWAKNHTLPELITIQNLKGILHNHTTWSDGIHTLEEMAKACYDQGYEYLGICDHSKSAFYANGLSIERVLEQQKAIDKLNAALQPFRIFKGIESDILHDGSLDYPDEILAKFDFIVASIHSGLKMEEQKATERLLTAISNPFTTILGHPTGRLLLARQGYPIDHKKIIDACAEYGVVIELNAHPYRLDIDWRWLQYAISKGVMISINPDAHAIEGYLDMYYGVCVARKGGLTADYTFNALNRKEIELMFEKRKKQFSSTE